MMRRMKWIGLVSGALLVVACFSTWVVIESRGIIISGVKAGGTSFGKPGYLHLLFGTVFILLTIIPRIWAKRANLLVTGMNLAWAVRNYFLITACHGGECPEKHIGIYLLLITGIGMLVSALFPDIELKNN